METKEIDPRIKQFSYSSLQLLHACPRKFQLYRLNSKIEEEESREESLTFCFGHAVGEGIQNIFLGLSLEETIWKMFLHWNVDLFAENPKQKKSFWVAMTAIQSFYRACKAGMFADYELVYYEGKPAIEFSFRVSLGEGFNIRGYVDVILQHSLTKEVVVIEVKTSSAANVNPATYKNSSQALGYSVVLDLLFPSLSSYKVIYYVFLTKSLTFERFDFTKNYIQRALWIQELLLEKRRIQMYEEAGTYPMHGENCFDFYRECQYLQICTLSTENLITPLSETVSKEPESYMVELSIQDLINSQLAKADQLLHPSIHPAIQPGDTIL